MNIQTVIVVGRATKDAEMLESKAGKAYVKFSIAVNSKSKKDEEATVTYYDVLLFDKQAENAKDKVKKGDALLVVGKPSFDAYVSKDKTAKPAVTILPNHWQVLK